MIFMVHSLKLLNKNGQMVLLSQEAFLTGNISINLENGFIKSFLLPTFIVLNLGAKFLKIEFCKNLLS